MNEKPTGNNAPGREASPLNDSVAKQEKRYARNRRLALIGLGVLVLGLCSFGGILTLNIRLNNPPSPVAISKTVISSLTITYDIPDMLKVGTPATFDVSMSNSEIQFNTTVTSQRRLRGTPIPNGTPNVPLSQAFGPGYMVFAYAQLDVSPASKFDLPPQLRKDSQSLEQQQLTFSWTITPKETTKAVITITITGQWKPIGAGNELDIPLWANKQPYNVSPSESPVSTPGQFITQVATTLGAALYAVLPIFGGLGLTVPWIVDQIGKRRNKPKQRETHEEKMKN
jgi:hypothetical protein